MTKLFLVGLIFWLSGLAGLVYEVVWFRLLATTFGSTGPAIAATTGSFMAGLGLGSRIVARYADRVRSPLRWYAILELALAGYALCMPFWVGQVESFYRWGANQQWSPRLLVPGQFVTIFLLLVVPTALMGATLPLMCRALVRDDTHLGRRFAWLYGINTLGAAAGATLAGFYLIQTFGLSGTSMVAVGVNVVAAMSAFLISRSGFWPQADVEAGMKPEPNRPALSEPNESVTGIFLCVFACGFAGLAAQSLWVRSLLFGFDRLKNTTYSFSAVLTVTLVGLTLGTVIGYVIVDRLRRPRRALSYVVAGIGTGILLSVGLLLTSPQIKDSVNPETLQLDFPAAVSAVAVRTMVVIGLPCVLLGLAMPVAVRCVGHQRSIGREVGQLYAVNTLGSVIGALVAAFLLPPILGLLPSLLWIGAAMLVVAAVVQRTTKISMATFGAVAVISGLVAVAMPAEFWWLQSLRAEETILALRDGVTGTVCVIENAEGERRICVDDVPVAGTSNIMQTDQKCLAHWSMLLAREPKKALTVGFGSGGASYSFLLHDQLEELHCVEISPDVPAMAHLLQDANHGLMDDPDPRYRIIFEDARAYLARTTDRYDIIVSDCTDLRYRSSANLYDLEYFQLCRDQLTPGGCTTIWMPLGGLSTDAFRMTLNTFETVFPNSSVFYLHNRWTHYVLLIGGNDRLEFSPERLRHQLMESDVLTDMSEIGMTNPYKIMATFLTSGRQLGHQISSFPLNTEDRPRLEFDVPRFDMGPWSAQKNLNFLRANRAPVSQVLSADTSEQDRANAIRFDAAARHIMTAQTSARSFRFEAAAREYLAAQQLTPEDPAIDEALTFPDLQDVAATGQPTATLLLGRTKQVRGDFHGALVAVQEFRKKLNAVAESTDAEKRQWFLQGLQWQPTADQWEQEIRAQLSAEINQTSE